MLLKVYKWERKHYWRPVRGRTWRDKREDEVMYITPDWFECKIGPDERRFWTQVCDARFTVTHKGDVTHVNNVRCDGLVKCHETFTPVSIEYPMGAWREQEALIQAVNQRVIPILENTPEHVVLRFGEETTADYDLVTRRWIG